MLKYLSENIINTEDFKEFDTENKKEIETIKKQISNTEEQIKNKKINIMIILFGLKIS